MPEGTKSDTYVLYVNPETHLIDRFLFTIADFGKVDTPFLMEVEYKSFDDIMLPVTRRYTPSDWDGNIPADAVWADEIMTNIIFESRLYPSRLRAPREVRRFPAPDAHPANAALTGGVGLRLVAAAAARRPYSSRMNHTPRRPFLDTLTNLAALALLAAAAVDGQ